MTRDGELLESTAEELFEDSACGLLSTGLDGTVLRVQELTMLIDGESAPAF